MRESIVVIAASNGSCFAKQTWEENNKCRWVGGARTKSSDEKKTLEWFTGQALKQDPKAEVVHADIQLNSLPNCSLYKDWQSPKQITESFLQAQQRLEQSGAIMLTKTGRRPDRGDNPEIFPKDGLQEKGVRFFRGDRARKLRIIFQRMGIMICQRC